MKRWVNLVIGAFCLICLLGVAACSHLSGYLDIVKDKGMSSERSNWNSRDADSQKFSCSSSSLSR
jgi:hypothetical protein